MEQQHFLNLFTKILSKHATLKKIYLRRKNILFTGACSLKSSVNKFRKH